MFCAGAAGWSGAAAGDAGIALSRFMYPAIGRALSRLSVAAALDAGILGSECADTQNAGSQRNEHCTKNAFPNSLFHGKYLHYVVESVFCVPWIWVYGGGIPFFARKAYTTLSLQPICFAHFSYRNEWSIHL